MKKPVAIARAREFVPAQRLLLLAVIMLALMTALILATTGRVRAEAASKPVAKNSAIAAGKTQDKFQDKFQDKLQAKMLQTNIMAASASTRSANDLAGVTSDLYTTGAVTRASLNSVSASEGAYGSRSVSRTIGLAPATALPSSRTDGELSPTGATLRVKRSWYPEAHNYLRPYHYRWRYWTPG